MTMFDPAAWVAEYESIGGRVCITREKDGWLALLDVHPRDEPGRGNEMRRELNARNYGDERNRALFQWVLEARGVAGTS